MKRIWAIPLLMLPLSGCLKDQDHAALACQLDAQKMYPKSATVEIKPGEPFSADERAAKDYARKCMKLAGYDFDFVQKRCPAGSTYYPEFVGGCYRPEGTIGRLIYRLETRERPRS